MISPAKIKNTLLECIENMSVDRVRFINNPEKNFIRNTKCNISTTTKMILAFEHHNLKSEIYNYFSEAPEKAIRKSTLVQQREKFSDDAFQNLFQDFNAKFPCNKKDKIGGMDVIACDGSDVNIPTYFQDKVYFVENNSKNGEGFYQLHFNAFYNVLENRFIDGEVQPRGEFDERKAFLAMLRRSDRTKKTLYLLDRGYFSWNMVANLIKEEQFFLIRLNDIHSGCSTFKKMSFPDDSHFDIDKSLKIVRGNRKKHSEKPDEYKCLPRKTVFDFISPEDKQSFYPIKLRIVCIKITEDQYEYLATNLPRELYSLEDLEYYYMLRWNEELSFRSLKYSCSLNWFHSIKRKFIIQELYARLIMYNYTSLLMQTVKITRKPDGKHELKLSFANAAKVARMYLVHKYTCKVIKTLLSNEKIPIRKGRHARRNVRSQRNNPLNNRA